MPKYFSDYDTTVHFISQEELKKNHSGIPHGGRVIPLKNRANGKHTHVVEYSIRLDSKPRVYRQRFGGLVPARLIGWLKSKWLAPKLSLMLRQRICRPSPWRNCARPYCKRDWFVAEPRYFTEKEKEKRAMPAGIAFFWIGNKEIFHGICQCPDGIF